MTNIFNPLDLHGPAFLVYYTAIASVIVGLLLLWQRLRESADTSGAALTDPYLVAYLRGGEQEPVRVAVAALIDRGLLESEQTWLSATPRAAEARVEVPLEKSLLAYFAEAPGRLRGAMEQPAIRRELGRLERTLLERGLIPTADQHWARAGAMAVAGGLLWTITALQIANRDPRYGIGFLFILTVGFTALAAYLTFRRRTAGGDRALADVRELLEGSRAAHAGTLGIGPVPALVLAAFGLSLLPDTLWARVSGVLPGRDKAKSDGSTTGCGGGGSSDGGGSSCGGGGGCGGGGCGGGCGGCGG